MLALMAKGQIKKAQPAEEPALDNGDRPAFQLQCDVNGCSIVPVSQSDTSRGPSGGARLLLASLKSPSCLHSSALFNAIWLGARLKQRTSFAAGSFVGSSGYSDSSASGAGPSDFVLAEGNGWKIGYDKKPADLKGYSALIGSDTWSMAVTKSEYDDFIKVWTLCSLPCFLLKAILPCMLACNSFQ